MITIHGNEPVGEFTPAGLLQKAADRLNLNIDFDLYCEGYGQPDQPQWTFDNYRLNGDHKKESSIMFYTQPGWGKDFERSMNRYKVKCESYACDPDFHKPHKVDKIYDVGFIGQSGGDDRDNYLKLIAETFPKSLIAGDIPNEKVPLELSKCKVLFNHIRTEEINIRFFENLAIGAQVATHAPALHLFAIEDEHYVTCKTPQEAIEKIQSLLDDDARREKMAKEARKHAIKYHTYDHRIKSMLKFAGKI